MKGSEFLERCFKSFLVAFAVFCAATLMAAPLRAQAMPAFRPGEVIVELRPGASIDAVNARRGTRTIQRIYGTNLYRLATPAGKKEKKVRKKLAKDPDVLSAALNNLVGSPINVFARSVISFPGDQAEPGQTPDAYNAQLNMLNLRDAQLRSRGDGVVVAVIDTGVDRSHPALAPRIWNDPRDGDGDGVDDDADGLIDDFRGWDFLDNDNDPNEEAGDPAASVAGHGTFIAGLIALIAPQARILPVRAFDAGGVSDVFTVAAAIKYAADHGAHVINLSLGSPEASPVLFDAIAYARNVRGSTLVAAVGNENQDTGSRPQFPASWTAETMGIAALDNEGRKASFSNFGSAVSVAAPGVSMISAFPGGTYARWSGTSFAAPLASAEAALILGADPRHPNVRGAIETTATSIEDPTYGDKLGRGRIAPLEALLSLDTPAALYAEMDLRPTGVEPGASGEAEYSITPGEHEFEVQANGLTARAAYRIVVDGNVVLDGAADARAVADNFGGLKVEFSSRPSSGDLPLPAALDPVDAIQQVEIRDAQDRVVLANNFRAPGGGGSSVQREARLVATAAQPGASGKARAEAEPQRQKLRVRADGLTPSATYRIVVDGVDLGPVDAQSRSDKPGFLEIEYTSDGSSGSLLPASLLPVLGRTRVQVLNSGGQVALQGDFQAAGDDSGGDDGGSGGDDGSGGGGDDGGDQDVRKEARLSATGIDADARGDVEVRRQGSREELRIEAENLQARTQFIIVIDGFELGTFRTDEDGELKLEWSTEGGELPLPQAVRPVTSIRRVEIRTTGGAVVLAGEFSS